MRRDARSDPVSHTSCKRASASFSWPWPFLASASKSFDDCQRGGFSAKVSIGRPRDIGVPYRVAAPSIDDRKLTVNVRSDQAASLQFFPRNSLIERKPMPDRAIEFFLRARSVWRVTCWGPHLDPPASASDSCSSGRRSSVASRPSPSGPQPSACIRRGSGMHEPLQFFRSGRTTGTPRLAAPRPSGRTGRCGRCTSECSASA